MSLWKKEGLSMDIYAYAIDWSDANLKKSFKSGILTYSNL